VSATARCRSSRRQLSRFVKAKIEGAIGTTHSAASLHGLLTILVTWIIVHSNSRLGSRIIFADTILQRRLEMLSFGKPSAESTRRFLATQAKLDFTYSAVGATAEMPPAGYDVDRTRIKLGEGERVFHLARAALQRWDHFRLGWVEAWSSDNAIQAGQIVAVMGRVIGLWWLNACRIVYVVDESGPISKFGFAYGTLPRHVESGEERFLVEWDRGDNSVWYDILAFSTPNQLLTRICYPIVRRLQKRFGRDSAASMLKAVQ
jgi:uncharacterized protein (UPF0548 family)